MKKKPIKRSIHFKKDFEHLPEILDALSKERGDSVNLLILKAIRSYVSK